MRIDGREVVGADQVRGAGSAADLPEDLPAGGELGDVLSLVVGDVHIARLVDRQVERVEELALPAAEAAELADKPPLRGEHLDPGIAAVGDVHLAIWADRDLPSHIRRGRGLERDELELARPGPGLAPPAQHRPGGGDQDRKSTRLNSSHSSISYAVFCLKKKKKKK